MRISTLFFGNTQHFLASYTFAVGITASALYSILDPIEKDTGLTLNDLNAGTGYMVREEFQCLCYVDAENFAVLAVWLGLLVLAASRAAIWKTARVSHLYSSNNSESKQTGVGWSPKLTLWYRPLRCGCLIREQMVNGSLASCYKDSLGLRLNPYVRYR